MKFFHQASMFLHSLMLVSFPCRVCGFTVLTPTSLNAPNDSRILYQKRFVRPANKQEDDNFILNDARKKRIVLPLQLIISSLFINSSPAQAGIGTVVPFDATLKEKFPGALQNYVIMLRLNSTLRKRGYLKKNTVFATLKSNDDLSSLMARDYGSLGEAVPLGDSSSFKDYIQNCQGKKSISFIWSGCFYFA